MVDTTVSPGLSSPGRRPPKTSERRQVRSRLRGNLQTRPSGPTILSTSPSSPTATLRPPCLGHAMVMRENTRSPTARLPSGPLGGPSSTGGASMSTGRGSGAGCRESKSGRARPPAIWIQNSVVAVFGNSEIPVLSNSRMCPISFSRRGDKTVALTLARCSNLTAFLTLQKAECISTISLSGCNSVSTLKSTLFSRAPLTTWTYKNSSASPEGVMT
mmetsp:Transcript_76142/g.210089  ORF Transcript_76142/g.210089 Transcript_76142/m.210089 type:complete len:216 (-) Transcript_76142:260-907(-)